MKLNLITFCLMGILGFVFGCNPSEIRKENLIGNWKAVRLNGDPINKHGFTSILLEITPDSIHITTQMTTFGDVTTKSEGSWQLSGNIFKSNIGEDMRESHIEI